MIALSPSKLRQRIDEAAHALGFEQIGIADCDLSAAEQGLRDHKSSLRLQKKSISFLFLGT